MSAVDRVNAYLSEIAEEPDEHVIDRLDRDKPLTLGDLRTLAGLLTPPDGPDVQTQWVVPDELSDSELFAMRDAAWGAVAGKAVARHSAPSRRWGHVTDREVRAAVDRFRTYDDAYWKRVVTGGYGEGGR